MDVLLYSKYSNSSKKLISQLEQTPELIETLNITCIDNKHIREQILSDQKIKVNVLPCLIRLNETTKNFDIYEGQNAFDFFTSLQNQIAAVKNQERERIEMQRLEREQLEMQRLERVRERERLETEMSERQALEKQNLEKKKSSKVEKVDKDLLKNAKNQESERHSSQNKFEEFKNKKVVSEPVKFTTIDELDLDDEKGDQENSINTYTHVERNQDSDFSERDVNSKKAEMSVKGTSILSKAMQMQKERN